MARQIEAYKLRTELAVDARQGSAAMKSFQKEVDNVGTSFKKLGPQIDTALKGKEAGLKFGQAFSGSATALITGSFENLGQSLGSIIGTAMMPGIGTAIGSMAGGAIDAGMSKMIGIMKPIIDQGMKLNKEVQKTIIEFKTFTGSEQEAIKYLEELKKLAVDSGTDFGWVVETSEKIYDLTGNLELTSKILKAATDQAADFGGEAETIGKIGEALGLIAEKGDLAGRELNKLYKLGINAKQYLRQATGLSEKQLDRYIAAGRVRGEVAAEMIATGITREKGGFAKAVTDQYRGAERFGVLTQMRAMEGTAKLTQAQQDMYAEANKVMAGPGAQKFVAYMDQITGSLVDMTKKGINAGLGITSGLAEGINSNEAIKTVSDAVLNVANYVTGLFNSTFEIKSPSELMKREVGIPLGQGIWDGMIDGYAQRASEATLKPEIVDKAAEFFKKYAEAAIEVMKRTGVPASNILAQAALESNFGRSGLTRQALNFFGVKGRGPAGSAMFSTAEQTRAGREYRVMAPFRKYNTAQESFLDFGKFLTGPRYRGALEYAGDPARYAQEIQRRGYATDVKYGAKVAGVISRYGLEKYNVGGGGGYGGAGGSWGTPTIPVAVVQWGKDDISNARGIFGGGGGPAKVDELTEAQKNYGVVVGETTDKLAEVTVTSYKAIEVDRDRERQIARLGQVIPRALQPLLGAEVKHAAAAIALTETYAQATKRLIDSSGMLTTALAGAIGQAGGYLPTQTPSKKRGVISQILGFAAPFLSLIPVVGPIASAVAGMASAGFGGNWGGVATGLAAGITPGGAFRTGASQPRTSGGSLGQLLSGGRQYGGPVYAGESYLVGERRPEIYTPSRNGYISPDAGGGGAMVAALAELRAAIQHLNTMPANQVVMRGARGLVRAMDHDAGLIRLVSQRQRLA